MEAIEALTTRRSVRTFTDKPVSRDVIEKIIDTARLAPTANNIQPWEFVVVTEPGMRKQLAGITDWGKFIAQSPVCLVVFCKDTKYYLEDGCAATENILVAAHALGLGTCWVAGDKKPYCSKIGPLLGVPDTYKLICLIALGYGQGKPQPHGKRLLKEVIHWERF